MNQEIKAEWIENMENQEYQFGKGALKKHIANRGICFCAGGVLVDMYIKKTRLADWKDINGHHHYRFVSDNDEVGAKIPKEVRLWAELPTEAANQIVYVNDAFDNTTFAPVIDYIKEKL